MVLTFHRPFASGLVFYGLRALPFYLLGDLFLFCVLLWSACLTYAVRVYRDASDNLFGSGESAARCLFSPLPTVFSRALFSTTLPTLVENECSSIVPTISAARLVFHRFVQHCGNVQLTGVCNRGMGKEESGGLGEKTRKGKGDCSRAAPLSPGCLPKITVNLYCVSLARRLSKTSYKQMVTKVNPYCLNVARRE